MRIYIYIPYTSQRCIQNYTFPTFTFLSRDILSEKRRKRAWNRIRDTIFELIRIPGSSIRIIISERMSSTGFAHYRDASSSSLTTGSGSSLASSTGGLHMNVPMASLTPIPVMITSPDGSLRRESVQSGQTEMKQPIFYTHNKVISFSPCFAVRSTFIQ